nr:multidrug resistance-associated protein 5 [Tanacetum cinerariifolium]
MPGRPRKLRIKHVTERVNVITRSGRMITCHNCWEKGHNKKGCNKEKQPKPTVEKRAPGRKKAGSNFVFQTCDKDGGDADPSSAGPSVADSTGSGTQTITEDLIVADPTDDIPTQQRSGPDNAWDMDDVLAEK